MDEVSAHNETNPAKGPDGKFSIQSHLQLLPSDWAPGDVYTCKVTHETGTQLLNISKKSGMHYFMQHKEIIQSINFRNVIIFKCDLNVSSVCILQHYLKRLYL